MDNEKDLNAIAQRMKQRRKQLNLSLQDVADITGLSRSTLQRYETGSIRNIPLQKLDTLSKALDTSADWLLGLTKDPVKKTTDDVVVKKLLNSFGIEIDDTISQTRMYIHGDIGSGAIRISEYNNLRDSIINYAKLNARNLLETAVARENERLKHEDKRIAAFLAALDSGESLDDAVSIICHMADVPLSDEK